MPAGPSQRLRGLALLTLAVLAMTGHGHAADPVDPATGLVVAEGWQTVRAHCGGCHSHQLVTSQRGDRATWLRMIRWMQETQNLWRFDTETENTILDYLTAHYAPPPPARRAPLPDALRPAAER